MNLNKEVDVNQLKGYNFKMEETKIHKKIDNKEVLDSKDGEFVKLKLGEKEEKERDEIQTFANLIQAILKKGEGQDKIPYTKEDYQFALYQIEKLKKMAEVDSLKVKVLSLLKKISIIKGKDLLGFLNNIKIENKNIEGEITLGEIIKAQNELEELEKKAEALGKEEITLHKLHKEWDEEESGYKGF